MRKNIAGQTFKVFAFDLTTGAPVTGDAANITANIRLDSGTAAATNDVNPTETEDGFYEFTATQAETNADVIQVFPASSTANTQVISVPGVIEPTLLDLNNIAKADGPIPELGIADNGTAQSATATTVVLRSGAVFSDNTLIGATIGVYGSSQAYWQFRVITGYTLSTDTATVDSWAVTPSGTLTYVVYGTPPSSLTDLPAVNIEEVNGVAVGGSGTTSDPWSPA